MRCYFIRNDHVVGVDMLPPGLLGPRRNRYGTQAICKAQGAD